MLPSTHKACGFTTLDDVNGKEYVPEFYTNDIENVNSQIKFSVNRKFPLDVFVQKMKDLIECQERQYTDASYFDFYKNRIGEMQKTRMP